MKENATVNHIIMSLLTSEVMLVMIEEYFGHDLQPEQQFVTDNKEILNIFNTVEAWKVLDGLKEYKAHTNMKGLVAAVKEVKDLIVDIGEDELISFDFSRTAEVM